MSICSGRVGFLVPCQRPAREFGVVERRACGRVRLKLIRPTSSIGLVAAMGTMAVVAGLLGCSSSRPETRAVPSGAELTTAVDEFVDQNLSLGIRNRRAILVSVDGELLVERYYDSSAHETAAVASVTKSIVSTLVGIAVSEGYLRIEQPLRELLPAYRDLMATQLGGITVHELLTMTAGLPADDGGDPRPKGDDWVADIVRRGTVQPPGQGFAYSSVSSHLLAAVLVEATGRPLLAYAREKLFDPLGIDTRPAFQPVLAAGRREASN